MFSFFIIKLKVFKSSFPQKLSLYSNDALKYNYGCNVIETENVKRKHFGPSCQCQLFNGQHKFHNRIR